jgi:Cu-processing system permease protein
MSLVLSIAADILREAASRKWFLALGLAVTLVLATMGFSLQMDVVDGALAGTRLFGSSLGNVMQPVDVALRPVFMAAAYLIFYGGLGFMIMACADFGPTMLSPGRIEHLLALPVRRWQLLFGTFLGVMALTALGTTYGAGGLTLILGVKTGVWTARPLLAGVFAVIAFAPVYATMLASALFARSAALSAAVGALVFIAGIVAGFRVEVARVFEQGAARSSFEAVSAFWPRVSTLGRISADLASSASVEVEIFASAVGSALLFAAGALALGSWRFEQRDF